MANQGKNKPVKPKETRYNRILKQFTVINNSLPEERKLSIKQRRQILKQSILPHFETTKDRDLRVKAIKAFILAEYNKIPSKPAEACNLNFLDPSNYRYPIDFYLIDEFIEKKIPDCIYIKITAGEYGETKIFNTRDYSYGKRGVQEITENIRAAVGNKSGMAYYMGYQKLRPKRKNDGQGDSYYLDMILNIDGGFQGVTKTTKFALPKTRQVATGKKNVQALLDKKFKLLQNEKIRTKNAKTKIREIGKVMVKAYRAVRKNPDNQKAKDFHMFVTLQFYQNAEKSYAKGNITKETYDNLLKFYLNKM